MVNLSNLFISIKKNNLNAKRVSEKTGISSGNISDWKNGRSYPSAPKLVDLSEILDCSIDYILGKTDCSVPWEVLEAFYQKISDKADNIFFEKEIIRFPSTLTSDYVIKENDYSKYIDVYDIAYKYAPDKVANIISKGDYISQIKKHSDIIDKLVGEYYTMNQESYNKFHEVYKIYCEAFTTID